MCCDVNVFFSTTFFIYPKKYMYNLICVTGPTACGKTSFAVQLADYFKSEIISADSRQVYKNMDLGTGKDLNEYVYKGKNIPYHLIDICDAGYKYNIFEYQRDFVEVWNQLLERHIIPILCGGSGLYLEAIVKGYKLLPVPVDEKLREDLKNQTLEQLAERLSIYGKMHNITDLDTKKRVIRAIEIEEYYLVHSKKDTYFPKIRPLILGIDISRELRRSRITERLKQRLNNGMVEEVKSIIDGGVKPEDLIYYGLEYKYITMYLLSKLSYDEMFDKLNIAIHQFAKRQMTWFRKMEKSGIDIHWLPFDISDDEKIEIVKKLYNLEI